MKHPKLLGQCLIRGRRIQQSCTSLGMEARGKSNLGNTRVLLDFLRLETGHNSIQFYQAGPS